MPYFCVRFRSPIPTWLVPLRCNVQRQKVERRGASYPDYQGLKAQAKAFDGMAAYSDEWFTVTGVDETERVRRLLPTATSTACRQAGPRPYGEGRPGRIGNPARVVLLSEGIWKRRFGSDPNVLGRQVKVDQRLHTVIGVMPPWFHGITDNAEMWAPFAAAGSPQEFAERGSRGFVVLARLKPGLPIRRGTGRIGWHIQAPGTGIPGDKRQTRVEVASLRQETVGDLRAPLLVLLGAVALVLLIACANVTNLLLARSETRRQELAIRTALGAGRGRVLRQLVTESLILSVAGAALGLQGRRRGANSRGRESDRPASFADPKPDWAVAAFAAILSAAVGIVIGVVPAFFGLRRDLNDSLKEGSRTGAGASRQASGSRSSSRSRRSRRRSWSEPDYSFAASRISPHWTPASIPATF